MMAITSGPRLYWPSSEASGRFTLMMMSSSFSASALTVAPAAVKSASGMPDLMPAPGSIAISTPKALNFFTVSGEAATRGSDGSISLATAIFMRPPGADARTRLTGGNSIKFRPSAESPPAESRGGPGQSSQENSHQCDDDHDADRAELHQLDEA